MKLKKYLKREFIGFLVLGLAFAALAFFRCVCFQRCNVYFMLDLRLMSMGMPICFASCIVKPASLSSLGLNPLLCFVLPSCFVMLL